MLIKNQRIPNESIYNIFITIMLAILIVWFIYISVNTNNYRLYLV